MSQDSLRPSSVDFSWCSTPPTDWYIHLLGTSTSHRCCEQGLKYAFRLTLTPGCETFTACALLNASISSWLCSFTDACMVWRVVPCTVYFTTSSTSAIPTAKRQIRRTRLSTVGDRVFPLGGRWKPPLEQSAARRHLSSNADCLSDPPQNSSLFTIISFLTVSSLVLYTVYSSGLAVLYLSHSK